MAKGYFNKNLEHSIAASEGKYLGAKKHQKMVGIDRKAKAKMIMVSLQPKELTSSGNEMKRGFSMAGSYGTEFDVEQRYLDKGFKELYNEAPYHWAVYNPKTLEIFTYTEGDTSLIKANSKRMFLKEIRSYQKFAKGQEEYIKPYDKIEQEVYE